MLGCGLIRYTDSGGSTDLDLDAFNLSSDSGRIRRKGH